MFGKDTFRKRLIAGLMAVTASLLGVVVAVHPAAAASGGGCATWKQNVPFAWQLGYLRMSPCISAQGSNVYSDSYTDFSHNTISWRSCSLLLRLERDGAVIASVTKDCTLAAQLRLTGAYFFGPWTTNSGTHTYQLRYDLVAYSTAGVRYDFGTAYSPFQYMP